MKKAIWGIIGAVVLFLAIILLRMNWHSDQEGDEVNVAPESPAATVTPSMNDGNGAYVAPPGEPFAQAKGATPLTLDERLEELKRTVPPEVGEVVERSVLCMYWSGEEPYDDERRAEIEGAIEKYACNTVFEDRDRLLERYKGDAAVEQALKESEYGFLND